MVDAVAADDEVGVDGAKRAGRGGGTGDVETFECAVPAPLSAVSDDQVTSAAKETDAVVPVAAGAIVVAVV